MQQNKGKKRDTPGQAGPETAEEKKILYLQKRVRNEKARARKFFHKAWEAETWVRHWQQKYDQLLLQDLKDTMARNKELMQKMEAKLVEHDLVPGKSKILTPCDGCEFNGNCRYQEIWRNFGNAEASKHCFTGRLPLRENTKARLLVFPFNLVDPSKNEDILN